MKVSIVFISGNLIVENWVRKACIAGGMLEWKALLKLFVRGVVICLLAASFLGRRHA